MKRRVFLGSLTAVMAACAANGESTWKELTSVDELRTRFNDDEGAIRIVLLLSPT